MPLMVESTLKILTKKKAGPGLDIGKANLKTYYMPNFSILDIVLIVVKRIRGKSGLRGSFLETFI